MSEQSEQANKWMREKFGAEVDAAAGAAGYRVIDGQGGDSGDGSKQPAKQWVELPGKGNRDLSDFAEDLGRQLTDTPLFRRENVLVTVELDTGLLKPMKAERFLTWVSGYVVVYEEIETGRGAARQVMKLRKTMPLTTARGCLESDNFTKHINPLARVNVVRQPVFRRDGRMELLPEGYDAESGIYTLPSAVEIDEKMPIEKACAIADDYYSEFTWADIDPATGLSRSKAVAITAAVALFGMGLQSVEAARMGFMFRANTQGGGKSLLAQMAITPSFGLPKNTPRASEEELRKVLDMAALQGAAYLFFDNLKNHLESVLLESYMTSPVWSGRVMGTQLGFEAKKSTVLLVTGNNLSVSPDLQRRLLQCDVFVENFDLQEKEHRRDLNPVVLSRPAVRSEFLSALWAMARHWDAKGRPPAGTREKPYRVATFAEWSDIFGGIVQCAGYGNPLVKPSEELQADQKTPHQRALVELLAFDVGEEKRQKEFTFQELVDCCYHEELFAWLLEGKVKEKDGGADSTFEVNAKCASKMGRMFTDEMSGKIGRVYVMKDSRRVRFVKVGEGRAKRYRVSLESAAAIAA